VPEGLSVPPVPKDDYEKQFLPQGILINFRVRLSNSLIMTYSLKQTFYIRANLGLQWRTAFHAISYSREKDRMKRTMTENI
jgi:hypothetical protein